MKKLSILFLALLLCNSCAIFGQTVKVNSIMVNSQPINEGTAINFGTNSSISVSLIADITLPVAPNDNNPGTITIYYKKNQTYTAVEANGGFGGTILFQGNSFASRSFVVELSASQFDATGGLLYAEYKTYSGTAYKSANISIVKNTSGGTNPGNPNPAVFYYEDVPYGGTPLVPRLPAAPDVITRYSWTRGWTPSEWTPENTFDMYNERAGEKLRLYDGMEIFQLTEYKTMSQTQPWQPSPLGKTNHFVMYVNQLLSAVKRLYIVNDIQKDQYITFGGNAQTITGGQASYNDNNNNTILMNIYKWQKRVVRQLPLYADYNAYLVNYGWKDIPNATQANYTPPLNITEVTEYRRLVIESATRLTPAASNVVTIYPISIDSNISNTICCDQLNYSNSTMSPIIGSTPANAGLYGYQWQIGTLTGSEIIWKEIVDATSKDYLPVRPPAGRRFPNGLVQYFRRILIKLDDNKVYFSNNATVTYYTSTGKKSNANLPDFTNETTLTAYPNPTSSVINIQGGNDVDTFEIKIVDLTGRTIITRKPGYTATNLLQLNIAELPSGVYNLILENKSDTIFRRIIKS